jgi:hypothetical protein
MVAVPHGTEYIFSTLYAVLAVFPLLAETVHRSDPVGDSTVKVRCDRAILSKVLTECCAAVRPVKRERRGYSEKRFGPTMHQQSDSWASTRMG